mmetsp:Transcript_9471/g.26567  ORF Transcript_9471/g.26567 Transcript_9471/m.26567 type:complete len:297 (-) Transcript_9471:613-1503(-)
MRVALLCIYGLPWPGAGATPSSASFPLCRAVGSGSEVTSPFPLAALRSPPGSLSICGPGWSRNVSAWTTCSSCDQNGARDLHFSSRSNSTTAAYAPLLDQMLESTFSAAARSRGCRRQTRRTFCRTTNTAKRTVACWFSGAVEPPAFFTVPRGGVIYAVVADASWQRRGIFMNIWAKLGWVQQHSAIKSKMETRRDTLSPSSPNARRNSDRTRSAVPNKNPPRGTTWYRFSPPPCARISGAPAARLTVYMACVSPPLDEGSTRRHGAESAAVRALHKIVRMSTESLRIFSFCRWIT